MRPWFMKEGDVVPFPKKDDKVIKLPNVGSYPNFLAGVEDLQSRVKKGELSDEMYKRLYTELLHRFMRRESAETPWFIKEDVTAPIDQKIDQLTDLAKGDPKLQDYVKNVFQKIIDYGKQAIGQKQESINEDPQLASLDQTIDYTKVIMDQLAKTLNLKTTDPKVLKVLEKSINDIKAYQAKEKAQEFEKSRVGREDLSRAITLVAGKVNGTLEQLEALYKQQKQQEGGTEIELKTSPGADQIRKDITDIIRGLIERYKDQYKDPKQFQIFEKLILDFLNSSIKGIVPLSTLIKHGAGNIVDEVKGTKFHPLVDNNFIQELLSKIPGKTSGNWGPGELGLAILGSPVSKGDKGDILVGGENIELKASNNPKKGGRIDRHQPNRLHRWW